jgi:hypothetical protein
LPKRSNKAQTPITSIPVEHDDRPNEHGETLDQPSDPEQRELLPRDLNDR